MLSVTFTTASCPIFSSRNLMSLYKYMAVDPQGIEMEGTLQVADATEALKRVKEMGLFPTRIFPSVMPTQRGRFAARQDGRKGTLLTSLTLPRRVKSPALVVFTRQLATLIEAGMPLLRGLKILREQEESAALKHVIGDLISSIENGGQLSEGMAEHPRTFNSLYVNMMKAGEIGGALDIALRRLSEFLEKADRIKGRIKAALFYPCAVLTVAVLILTVLMIYVIPKFKDVFAGLGEGRPLPPFTRFVFGISEAFSHHFLMLCAAAAFCFAVLSFLKTTAGGRSAFDRLKLRMPLLGPLFRKAAISRFSRTLGTLLANGVPVLQALTIVQQTAANRIVAKVIGQLHDDVQQGETMAPRLKASGVFPVIVAGMVDVGEQTGALPDMLLKVADTYDAEVENATNALNSLLEPVLIVFLAVIVGAIVVAMFLPILDLVNGGLDGVRPGEG
jgi:type IV pilus assembly protein PilC